jgi:hypothetical protein
LVKIRLVVLLPYIPALAIIKYFPSSLRLIRTLHHGSVQLALSSPSDVLGISSYCVAHL